VRDNSGVSHVRHEAFINAPVERIWELVSDLNRHPEWWPRVLETDAEHNDVGSTYRQVMETPAGSEVSEFQIEGMEDYRRLAIRCLNSGMFLRFGLTEAQSGTFVEGEMGMDPVGISNRVFDMVTGRRYFRTWISETFEGLERVATREMSDAPGPAQP
jgi:Polyketide cyclase / dehydrase and lipid transport